MKKGFKIFLAVLLVIIMCAATALIAPFIFSLSEEANRIEFKALIESFGFWSVFILLGIQILQVVVAFLPGEPVEVIAGVMYGTFGGLFICLTGILISTIAIFYTVRHFGEKMVAKAVKKEETAKYSFLFKENNLTYIIFILFLIPGVPKDVLIYICPFTKIKPLKFFTISIFARIPSIITSTYAGENIYEGNFMISLLVFAVTGLLGILGIIFHNKFIKNKNEKNVEK